MKQTAVEYVKKKLRGAHVKGDFIFNGVITSELIEQAKEMEREQIIRARQDGLDNGFSNGSWDSNLYYNETFKSE